MTCKDCIHNGICISTQVESKHKKVCKSFKNKADFVEVVRCKDCNGSYIARDGKMRCALQDDIPLVEPSHFCSYGERK